MAELLALEAAIAGGHRDGATGLVTDALREGTSAQAILDAMTAAMKLVGDRFSSGEIYVPEMLISARAMKAAMTVLEPVLVDAGIRPEFTAILGTVEGDLHDIGKNLVGMMWRGANFEVIDLGTNVSPAAFTQAALEHSARIVGVSALLTTTMGAMANVVKAIRASDRPGIAVIVGGAPVSKEFAHSIGADGCARDAAEAVTLARALVGSATYMTAGSSVAVAKGMPAASSATDSRP